MDKEEWLGSDSQIKALNDGCEKTFLLFFVAHKGTLLGIAKNKIYSRSYQDSEDVVLKSLKEFSDMIAGGKHIKNPFALLKTIVKQRCKDFNRHYKNNKSKIINTSLSIDSTDHSGQSFHEKLIHEQEQNDNLLEQSEIDEVNKWILCEQKNAVSPEFKLSQQQKLVYKLHFIEDLSQSDIARKLARDCSTINEHLKEAIKKLKRIVKFYLIEDEFPH